MGSLTQVVNGEYIGADKYVIEDAGDGKSTVVFSPDNVLKEGTPVGAELLNEIQKNGLYYLAGTHRVDGQESIYDCTLIGIDTFDFTQLNVLFKPDTKPTQSTIKLNISGEVYTINGNIGEEQIGIVLVKSNYTAYTWANKTIVINDLTTGGATNALAAQQGVILNNKLNEKSNTNHTHDDRYYTESEIDTKFKNFCPFPVNSLYLSLGSENPSTLWLGTTWQKQEGRFLLGSSGSYALGSTGGASTVKLAVANLPSHTHSASQSAHTHSQPAHTHKINLYNDPGANYVLASGGGATRGTPTTTSAGGDTTGSATPSISIGATGSGTAFSIMPPYLAVNIWKRLS